MNASIDTLFDELDSKQTAPEQMLGAMIDHFRSSRQPTELFETLKMQTRLRLGLPLLPEPGSLEQNNDDVERKLESGLLAACREAGQMMLCDGQITRGWMYLRPLDDLDFVRGLLDTIKVTDENYDEMVQVLLHEQVDVAAGIKAVLEHEGICPAITAHDQWIAGAQRADRQAVAVTLLKHIYEELTLSVRADIAQRDKTNPHATHPDGSQQDLGEMLAERPWLLENGVYHLDTSHISAMVRIASVLDSPEWLDKASQLATYGRKLDHAYQHPGEDPFTDFYPAYTAYYNVLLGKNVDAGLKLFERKAKTVPTEMHATEAIEVYLELLDRAGQSARAVVAATELIPADIPIAPLIPTLVGYARRAANKVACEKLMAECRRRGDMLGFTVVANAKSNMNHSADQSTADQSTAARH